MTEFIYLIFPIKALISGEANARITFLFIGMITLFWGYFWVSFRLKTKHLYRQLSSPLKQISNVKRPAPARLKHELEQLFNGSLLNEAWQEFQDSLVTRRDENQNEIVYKTEESALYFSEERLINQNLNLRYLNSVPGLLVGLGILGTFVGLTFGLGPFSKIDFTEASQIQRAIQELLSGISIAFTTSVWGMATSIAFNIREKRGIRRLSRTVFDLQRALDQLFTLTTQEEIKYRQLDELEQQTQALKAFSTDLADRIKIVMGEIMSQRLDDLHRETRLLQESGAKRTEQILQHIRDAAEQIANHVSQAVSDTLSEKLTPALEDVSSAVSELKKQKEESSEAAIRQLVSNFQQSLSGTAMSELEALAQNVKQASSSLASLPNQVVSMIGKVNDQIDRACNLMEQSTAKMNEDAEKRSAHAEEQLQQQIAGIEQVFGKMTGMLMDTMEQQRQAVREVITHTMEESAAATDMMKEEVEASAQAFGENIRSLREDVSKLLEQQIQQVEQVNSLIANSHEVMEKGQGLVKQMGESTARVSSVMNNAQELSRMLVISAKQFDKAGERLSQISSSFAQQNEKYLAGNRETIQKIQESLAGAQQLLSDFSSKFGTIEEGLSGIFGQIQQGMAEYAVKTRESINKYLDEFSNQLSSAASALADSVNALQDDVLEPLIDMLDRESTPSSQR